MPGESLIKTTLKGGILDLETDEIVMDALKDIVREELKGRMKEALDHNPELKAEFKEAVRMYFEAKVMQTYAEFRLAKASAKLGLEVMPPPLREKLGREVAQMLEKEVTSLLEKAL
ncbi:MAG TPA: hypothetical protein VNZ52_01645 [Candidatus Thermoplasmatota archaeon]|nr:hypothetical protein [Candidatus Thermoplasmatota archaeon]